MQNLIQIPIRVEWDTFEDTAKILAVINPVTDYTDCLTKMVEMTNKYGLESAYFGTLGFYIICFGDVNGPEGRSARAVLMPYTVKRYLMQTCKIAV